MRNRATKLGATGLNRFKRNPLNAASWKLFNNGELSPLVQSGATSMGWVFDANGDLVARPHNFMSRSEEWSNAVYGRQNIDSVTEQTVTTPTGAQVTLSKIVPNTTHTTHRILQSYAIPNGRTVTGSCVVHPAEYDRAILRVRGVGGGFGITLVAGQTVPAVIANFGGGVIQSFGSEVMPDGLIRFWATGVINDAQTTTALEVGVRLVDTESFAGDGVSGILYGRAQLNEGELQPYYPTTGTAYYGPRVSYDPADLSVGKFVLAEEVRTNLLLNNQTLATQTVTVTAAVHTLSFYGTGAVTLSGAATGTITGTGVFPSRRTFSFTPSAGSLTLTVTGSVTLGQLELGATASSPILTYSTAVTRAADNLSVTNLAATGFNASEGTLYGDTQIDGYVVGLNENILAAQGVNGSQNQIGMFLAGLQGNYRSVITANNTNTFLQNVASTSQVFDRNRFAVAYKENDSNSWGRTGNITDTSVAIPAVTTLRLGPTGQNASCRIYQAAIIPKRLPDATLQKLTRV